MGLEEQIKYIEKELTALKTMPTINKYAIPMYTNTATISSNFSLSGVLVTPQRVAILTATAIDGSDMIMDVLVDTVSSARGLSVIPIVTSQGKAAVSIYLREADGDYETLNRGGTVSASFNLIIRTTSRATLELTYRSTS